MQIRRNIHRRHDPPSFVTMRECPQGLLPLGFLFFTLALTLAMTSEKLSGIYPATVVDDQDPLGRFRVRVRLTFLDPPVEAWAECCIPSSSLTSKLNRSRFGSCSWLAKRDVPYGLVQRSQRQIVPSCTVPRDEGGYRPSKLSCLSRCHVWEEQENIGFWCKVGVGLMAAKGRTRSFRVTGV